MNDLTTSGKVILQTSIGDYDIELFAQQSTISCKLFIQNILNGLYNNTTVSNLQHDYIVQIGSNDTIQQNNNINQYPVNYMPEFNSRLRYNQRGIVGLYTNDTTQFFITLSNNTNDLNTRHCIIGRIVGDTLFNLTQLNTIQCNDDNIPIVPIKIHNIQIVYNPFNDVKPVAVARNDQTQNKTTTVKNKKLLSFVDDDDDDYNNNNIVIKKTANKQQYKQSNFAQSTALTATQQQTSIQPTTSTRQQIDDTETEFNNVYNYDNSDNVKSPQHDNVTDDNTQQEENRQHEHKHDHKHKHKHKHKGKHNHDVLPNETANKLKEQFERELGILKHHNTQHNNDDTTNYNYTDDAGTNDIQHSTTTSTSTAKRSRAAEIAALTTNDTAMSLSSVKAKRQKYLRSKQNTSISQRQQDTLNKLRQYQDKLKQEQLQNNNHFTDDNSNTIQPTLQDDDTDDYVIVDSRI